MSNIEVVPGSAPGQAPGGWNGEPGAASGLQSGTFIDYLLTYSSPERPVYVGMNIPVAFTFTRADGQPVQVQSTDTASLTATLPDGTQSEAATLTVSSFEAASSVALGARFLFAAGPGTYVFAVTLLIDSQDLIAKKTLIVS